MMFIANKFSHADTCAVVNEFMDRTADAFSRLMVDGEENATTFDLHVWFYDEEEVIQPKPKHEPMDIPPHAITMLKSFADCHYGVYYEWPENGFPGLRVDATDFTDGQPNR